MIESEKQAKYETALAEIFALAGVALICVGAWMIYRPAAFLVAGIVLLYVAATLYPGRRR